MFWIVNESEACGIFITPKILPYLPEIVLKLLVSRKIGPNYGTRWRRPIMHHACCMGWSSVVTHLLADMDLVYDETDKNGYRPQHVTAKGGYVGVMKLLHLGRTMAIWRDFPRCPQLEVTEIWCLISWAFPALIQTELTGMRLQPQIPRLVAVKS
jgi:hypothetical protein